MPEENMPKSELTKRALAASIEALLEKKPLDRITIKDITDECGVTRNTFYYHFEDVYDLLSYIFKRQADTVIRNYAEDDDWEGFFLNILTYLNENSNMINNVYYSMRQEELELYIKKVVGVYALQVIDIQTRGADVDEYAKKAAADFYKNAFVGATLQWIREGMQTEPALMAALYDSMFQGTVKAAIASAERAIKK
jgi:probable dihydroxyacetone kinase regulator